MTPHPASTARCVQGSPGPVRAPSSAWLNGRIGSTPETEFSAAEFVLIRQAIAQGSVPSAEALEKVAAELAGPAH